MKYLFICGCPRSGTSALAQLVNLHSEICVGIERYFNTILNGNKLNPEMFNRERLLNYQKGDSFWSEPPFFEVMKSKYDDAVYVGEKLPRLYEKFNLIEKNFDLNDVYILYIFRDVLSVAESYQVRSQNTSDVNWGRDQDWRVAIKDWNMSIEMFLAFKNKIKLLPIRYESLFACKNNDVFYKELERICFFLSISPFSEQSLVEMFKRFFGRTESHGGGKILPQNIERLVVNSSYAKAYNEIISIGYINAK